MPPIITHSYPARTPYRSRSTRTTDPVQRPSILGQARMQRTYPKTVWLDDRRSA